MNTIFELVVEFLLGILVGMIFTGLCEETHWHTQAISHHAASFNPTNGVFQWNQ